MKLRANAVARGSSTRRVVGTPRRAKLGGGGCHIATALDAAPLRGVIEFRTDDGRRSFELVNELIAFLRPDVYVPRFVDDVAPLLVRSGRVQCPADPLARRGFSRSS